MMPYYFSSRVARPAPEVSPRPPAPVTRSPVAPTPALSPAAAQWEQEANRVADRTVRGTGGLRETCACGGGCPRCVGRGANVFPFSGDSLGNSGKNVFEAPASLGRPLDGGTAAQMESEMGADFRGVRIHTDERAAQTAQALSAQAFAVGNDIYFNKGRYSPASGAGKHLLAHELTHAVQQRSTGRALVQTQPDPNAPPLGPIDQAKSDIVAAVRRSVERLQQAMTARDSLGVTPHDVDEAMCRFFPGFGTDFYEDIVARIQPMTKWIPPIPAVRVPRPAPASFRDALYINMTKAPQPAQAMVRRNLTNMDPGPDYIALFDEWYADASLQPTRLLHEIFHFDFTDIFHAPPLNDAFVWQCFVSVLGGLPIGPAMDKRVPPCR